MNKNEHWFFKLVQENTITIILVSLSTLGTLFNLYMVTRLAPIYEDMRSVKGRVEAIELDREHNQTYIDQFIEIRAIVPEIKNDVIEIKDNVKEIKNDIKNLLQDH